MYTDLNSRKLQNELKLKDFSWSYWSLGDYERWWSCRHVIHINGLTLHLLDNSGSIQPTIFCKNCSHVIWTNRKVTFWPEHALSAVRKGCREVQAKFPPWSGSRELIFEPDTTGPHRTDWSPKRNSNTRGLEEETLKSGLFPKSDVCGGPICEHTDRSVRWSTGWGLWGVWLRLCIQLSHGHLVRLCSNEYWCRQGSCIIREVG